MSEAHTCFACEREARLACPRCGRFYCEIHGDLLCSVCLSEEDDAAYAEVEAEPQIEAAAAAAWSRVEAIEQAYPDAFEPEDDEGEEDDETLPEGYDAQAQPSPFPEPVFDYQPAFRPAREEPQFEGQAPFVTCFACDREPVQQCPRCGRPYCEDHGEELCAYCLQPATGVPSFSLYRGSLLALGFAALLAIWLIVQPTGSDGDTGLRPVVLTPTAVVAAGNQTPGAGTTPAAGTTPGATTTPAANRTPAAGTTPATSTTPAAGTTPSSGASGSYTVASGDTLTGICSSQRPAMGNADCVLQLRTLNNLSGDVLSIGQSLRLP